MATKKESKPEPKPTPNERHSIAHAIGAALHDIREKVAEKVGHTPSTIHCEVCGGSFASDVCPTDGWKLKGPTK